jgi:hypothetical protein
MRHPLPKKVLCRSAKVRGAACGAADLGGFGWVAGVTIGAGVVEQLLDGLRSGVGDGDPDGHLVLVRPVQDLHVQGGIRWLSLLSRCIRFSLVRDGLRSWSGARPTAPTAHRPRRDRTPRPHHGRRMGQGRAAAECRGAGRAVAKRSDRSAHNLARIFRRAGMAEVGRSSPLPTHEAAMRAAPGRRAANCRQQVPNTTI